MSFEKEIQEWVLLDNQMKNLHDKMKEIRDRKNALTQNIISHAEKNNLTNTVVQIPNGKLKFSTIKDTQPLTFKYLETCLNQIIKNENQVKQIVEYIKNKREVKHIPEIKRFSNN